jgi:hypothetical protein
MIKAQINNLESANAAVLDPIAHRALLRDQRAQPRPSTLDPRPSSLDPRPSSLAPRPLSLVPLIPLLLLSFALCLSLPAATVTGTLQDVGLAPVVTNLVFTPLSTPTSSGSSIIIFSKPKTITTTALGAFSTNLAAGDYKVQIGLISKDSFLISVPTNETSYSWVALATNTLTYTYGFVPAYVNWSWTNTLGGAAYLDRAAITNGLATVGYVDAAALASGTNKGDLFVYNGTNVVIFGLTNASDYVLSSDSNTATGLKWIASATTAITNGLATTAYADAAAQAATNGMGTAAFWPSNSFVAQGGTATNTAIRIGDVKLIQRPDSETAMAFSAYDEPALQAMAVWTNLVSFYQPVLLENLTADRALVTKASGRVTNSAVTVAELEHLSGVTGGVQTNIDARLPFAATNDLATVAYAQASSMVLSNIVATGALTNSPLKTSNTLVVVLSPDVTYSVGATNSIIYAQTGSTNTLIQLSSGAFAGQVVTVKFKQRSGDSVLITTGVGSAFDTGVSPPVELTQQGESRTFVFNKSGMLWMATAHYLEGLATTSDVLAATNGLADSAFVSRANLTNGLATTGYVAAATNGLADSAFVARANLTNGLATTGYVASATNGLGTAAFWPSNAFVASEGGSASNLSVYGYVSSSVSNGFGSDDLVTAGWVRGLFDSGQFYYTTTNTTSYTNTGSGEPIYAYSTDIPRAGSRTYSGVTNNQYLGSVATTNRFTSLSGPASVNVYAGFNTGGGRAVSIKAEIYYSYDGTNWLGDWDTAGQALAGGSNLYTFVIPFPQTTATNTEGFFVERRFKVTSVSAAPNVTIYLGTNTPSSLSFSGNTGGSGSSSLVAVAQGTNAVVVTNTVGSTTVYTVSATGTGTPGASLSATIINTATGIVWYAAGTSQAVLYKTNATYDLYITNSTPTTNIITGDQVWVDIVPISGGGQLIKW